jgi:two-component system sensor histidine kinase BaeS
VTRRLVLALVGMTLATLVGVGLVTLLLVEVSADHATEKELRSQVSDLAASVPPADQPGAAADRLRLVASVRRALRLLDLTIVRVDTSTVTGKLPEGVSADQIDETALAAGQVVSGVDSGVAYAAAPIEGRRATFAVVATRPVSNGLGRGTTWFLVASLLTLVAAGVVALLLGRRLTRPVRDAQEITGRIAAGDLHARLPDPPARSHDELAELARSINVMGDSLAHNRQLDQHFLLSVSHDLRTPLTSIRGYAEAIADGATPSPADAAKVIEGQAARLERLVTDLLELARLESRAFSLDLRPVDASAVVKETVAAAVPAATGLGVALEVDAPAPCPMQADPDRLGQLVGNLVDNAVGYADHAVHVAVHRDGADVVIEVGDDGPGIHPDELPHVFERLYVGRSQPPRRVGGSGLGLAIVRELAVAMGATVAAASPPEGGTLLRVSIPT